MAAGQHPSDFVGYSVGVPNIPAAATVGHVGLLDFIGYPVGLLSVTPPTPTVTTIGTGMALRRRKPPILDDEEVLLILESQKTMRISWKVDKKG